MRSAGGHSAFHADERVMCARRLVQIFELLSAICNCRDKPVTSGARKDNKLRYSCVAMYSQNGTHARRGGLLVQASYEAFCTSCEGCLAPAKGMNSTNTVPRPTLLRTRIEPLCLSTISFDTHKPSPVPSVPFVV